METEIKVNFPEATTRERTKLVPLLPPQSEQEARSLAAVHAELQEAAAADQHIVLGPTHAVVKGGQVVGYASVGGLPTMHVWLDSQRANALDSVRMLEHVEVVMRERGIRHVLLPCAVESPFTPHLERLGFRRLGPTVLYMKEV